ncbi:MULTISPECIES: GlxA family transcriptional regulator [Streptacidiphilus]|uniref:GlxA family transcriptional regulator n=1 Tax=Streptacidiphilus cavernicola TaxID=3342716 RepID=A0ABV6UFW3_9ACTN|nr:helix-turn-helix domain-containing protein [Streptacidiphilus jeojiense]
MHRVAVLAVPPATTFDLSIPELVFGSALVNGAPAYEVRVGAPDPGLVEAYGGLQVSVRHGLEVVDGADTVIVTGTGARSEADPRVLAALRRAAAAGSRIASICTGAFVLAQAGLLDGHRATTYWPFSAELAQRFPAVDVVGDVLFVDDGAVLTSAGLAAGMDLCLHLVRSDHGAAVAAAVARLAVVSPARYGDQAQVAAEPPSAAGAFSLAGTRAWALGRLDQPLALVDLAAHAHTSVRTLTRRFQAETGLTPLQWLLDQRVDRARELLELTDLPVERVAERSGLGSADSLRHHLSRRVRLTPTAYRRRYSGPTPGTGTGTTPGTGLSASSAPGS